MDVSSMEKSEIREFYKDAKVFITGATGFVGKTLIEKLLRLTEVDTVYILIREKKGKTVQERLDKIFSNPVFDLLKTQNPTFQSKIKTIVGECGVQNLGISSLDRETLIANVNVIFHAAATVNFDENLKTAYDINFGGIKCTIKLAKEMKNLKSLVYVSTAYSNCIKNTPIKEEVYEYPFDDVVAKLDNMSIETAEIEKERIIGEWPNTYTYTKALSELLVKRESKNIPIGIFRPSIITSTYKEPMAGWIDNIYAINGVAFGLMLGFLRVFKARSDAIMDIVPVDMCISAMLSLAKDIAENSKTRKDLLIYNYTSGKDNPITYDLFRYLNINFGVPADKAIWCPSGIFVMNPFWAVVLSFMLHIIPAFLMDVFAFLTGNKPRLLSLYSKSMKFGDRVKFFGERDWKFDNSNVQDMWMRLNKADKVLFPFDISTVSWVIFSGSYSKGLRRYILKEGDNNIHNAFTKYYRFKFAHHTLQVLTAYLIFSILNFIFSKLFNAFYN